MVDLMVGQKLWCLNGETVVLKRISENTINVVYCGKEYTRPTNIIGKKLFVSLGEARSAGQIQKLNKEDRLIEHEDAARHYSHRTRKRPTEAECVCDDTIHLSSSNIKAYWPKYGDATRLRIHNRRR